MVLLPTPGLASLHTVSPAPTRSRLPVYQRQIRVFQRLVRVHRRRIRVYQQDHPSLSTPDPSPSASDPSLSAPNPSLLAPDHPSLSAPFPPLSLGRMKTLTPPHGLARLHPVSRAPTLSRLPSHCLASEYSLSALDQSLSASLGPSLSARTHLAKMRSAWLRLTVLWLLWHMPAALLFRVGAEQILLSNSTRLADTQLSNAKACGLMASLRPADTF